MILVTGGTGLLGSHLLFALASSGKKVRAIKRKGSNTAMVEKIFSYYTNDVSSLFKSIEWFDADLLDYDSIVSAMEGITHVYHCAAMVSFRKKDHDLMQKVNIDATANLVNIALDNKISGFCHVSSIAALGRTDNTGLTDEETYWKTTKKNSMYSISKYGAEREVWRGTEEGLPAVIVNPSVILGPGFWEGNSGLFRLMDNGLKFYTEGVNGFVDVRDVAAAMISLMEKELWNNRFVLSAVNLSYRELFNIMARNFGKPEPAYNVRPFVAGIAWRYLYLVSLLKGRKPDITGEIASTAVQKYNYSSEKIIKMADFRFRPIEKTIEEICTIYQSDNKIVPVK